MTTVPNRAYCSFAAMQRDEHVRASQRARRDGAPPPTALTIGTAENYLAHMDDDWVQHVTGIPASTFRAALATAVVELGADADLDALDAAYPACTWLTNRGRNEDGDELIENCGANVTFTDTGWSCQAGHAHVNAETRHAEGWDYAADEGEAALLRRAGMNSVHVSGGSI